VLTTAAEGRQIILDLAGDSDADVFTENPQLGMCDQPALDPAIKGTRGWW